MKYEDPAEGMLNSPFEMPELQDAEWGPYDVSRLDASFFLGLVVGGLWMLGSVIAVALLL